MIRNGVLILAMAIGACSDGDTASRAPSEANVSTAESATEAMDAMAVAERLRSLGLPLENVTAVTESSDSNNLLGRPGQYTSKVFFFDERHPRGEGDEGENTIEVFATAEDAQRRRDYIASVTEGISMLAQYQYLHGNVLLRLHKVILPSEAAGYERGLSSI